MSDFWDEPEPGWGAPILGGDPGGFDLPNGPQVQARDVLTQTTVGTGQDQWSGWLQNLAGGVAGYLVKKDAAKNGVQTTTGTTPNGQPVYAAPAAPNLQLLMIVGGIALVAVVVLARGK